MDAPERTDERVFRMRHGRRVPLEFTRQSVSQFFGGTMTDAARHFGVSLCSMKRVCRALGLVWPKSMRTRSVLAPLCKKRKGAVFPEAFVRVFPRGRECMDVSVETLSGMFGGTQQAAAGRLGVSLWTLKSICRRLGTAWPRGDPRRRAVPPPSMELPAWPDEEQACVDEEQACVEDAASVLSAELKLCVQ